MEKEFPIEVEDERPAIRKKPCAICGAPPPSQSAHIKTRGSGSSNLSHNIYPACQEHHDEQGSSGFLEMTKKYPQFARLMAEKGWEYDSFFKKWHNTKEAEYGQQRRRTGRNPNKA